MWSVDDCSSLETETKPSSKELVVRFTHERKVVCVIPCGRPLFLSGMTTVTLIWGAARLFGYRLKKFQRERLYSILGSPSLSISPVVGPLETDKLEEAFKEVFENPLPAKFMARLNKYLKGSGAVVVLEPFQESFYEGLPEAMDHQELNSELTKIPLTPEESTAHCILDEGLDSARIANKCLPRDDWDQICRHLVSEPQRTIICGGKGVGKSCFLRYIVNKYLNKHSEVLVIDFDIGQSEFTMPGCISAVKVTSPLFGPNYTHLKTPEMSYYLGNVDVTKCVDEYIKYLILIIDYCKNKFPDTPWVINCMGYCKGLGVPLTCFTIKKSSPTFLIEIKHPQNGMGYDIELTNDFVSSHLKNLSFRGEIKDILEGPELDYQYCSIPSFIEAGQTTQGTSKQLRKIVTLSYLNEAFKKTFTSIPPPIEVPLDNISLKSLETIDDKYLKNIVNGEIVGLCIEENNIKSCLGYGLVRGINSFKNTLLLSTPVDNAALSNVNVIYQSKLSLNRNQNDLFHLVGHVPFHVAGLSDSALFKPVHRSFHRLRHVHQS